MGQQEKRASGSRPPHNGYTFVAQSIMPLLAALLALAATKQPDLPVWKLSHGLTSCEPPTFSKLNFGNARVAWSNLGGLGGSCENEGVQCTFGPTTATTPQDVYYENVGIGAGGERIDLRIVKCATPVGGGERERKKRARIFVLLC